MYSQSIRYDQVEKLDTLSRLPAVSLRTNGYSFNKTMIGNFRMKDGSDARLYIRKNSRQFIRIQEKENALVYIGLGNFNETVALFDELKKRTNK